MIGLKCSIGMNILLKWRNLFLQYQKHIYINPSHLLSPNNKGTVSSSSINTILSGFVTSLRSSELKSFLKYKKHI